MRLESLQGLCAREDPARSMKSDAWASMPARRDDAGQSRLISNWFLNI